MSSQTSGSLIILIILGLVSWYYFNKFQQSEQNYRQLYYEFEKVYIDNKNMKTRINDLESYKNDISKTFNVLDKELLIINNHLQNRNNNENKTLSNFDTGSAKVSIITPELLHTLLNESDNEIENKTNKTENKIEDIEDKHNEIENKIEDIEDKYNEIDNKMENLEYRSEHNIESDLKGNLERDNITRDIELEHLNLDFNNNYNKFLIN